jgi:ribosome-binding protein aMBF1 (putative translation factor)
MISYEGMKNKLSYSFNQDLNMRLKNPVFKKHWEESQGEYELARQLIALRLQKMMSQRELARKAKTTQAVISRIETMQANPSLQTLKRIASVLGSRISFNFT